MTDRPLQLIDTQEVRRLTGYSRSTVDRRRKDGEFPIPVRDRNSPTAKHRYYLHEVEDYILSKTRHDISDMETRKKGR